MGTSIIPGIPSRVIGGYVEAINVQAYPYNAKGNGVTDDTAALTRAFTDAKTRGGRVFFPLGVYPVSDMFDLSSARDIEILGEGCSSGTRNSAGVRVGERPRIVTRQAGAATTFLLASAQGISMRRIEITPESDAFTGTLIKAGRTNPVTGADAAHLAFEDLSLGGLDANNDSAAACLNLQQTILVSVKNCGFRLATRAIVGKMGDLPGDFSNVVEIKRCSFEATTLDPVVNPGESWSIEKCAFEGRSNGMAGGVGLDDTFFLNGAFGLKYSGNWHGDVSLAGGHWLRTRAYGAAIMGNYFGSVLGGAGFNLAFLPSQGVFVAGNRFDGVNCINFEAASTLGAFIVANDFQGGGVAISNRGNAVRPVIFGNNPADGAGNIQINGSRAVPEQALKDMIAKASAALGFIDNTTV